MCNLLKYLKDGVKQENNLELFSDILSLDLNKGCLYIKSELNIKVLNDIVEKIIKNKYHGNPYTILMISIISKCKMFSKCVETYKRIELKNDIKKHDNLFSVSCEKIEEIYDVKKEESYSNLIQIYIFLLKVNSSEKWDFIIDKLINSNYVSVSVLGMVLDNKNKFNKQSICKYLNKLEKRGVKILTVNNNKKLIDRIINVANNNNCEANCFKKIGCDILKKKDGNITKMIRDMGTISKEIVIPTPHILTNKVYIGYSDLIKNILDGVKNIIKCLNNGSGSILNNFKTITISDNYNNYITPKYDPLKVTTCIACNVLLIEVFKKNILIKDLIDVINEALYIDGYYKKLIEGMLSLNLKANSINLPLIIESLSLKFEGIIRIFLKKEGIETHYTKDGIKEELTLGNDNDGLFKKLRGYIKNLNKGKLLFIVEYIELILTQRGLSGCNLRNKYSHSLINKKSHKESEYYNLLLCLGLLIYLLDELN